MDGGTGEVMRRRAARPSLVAAVTAVAILLASAPAGAAATAPAYPGDFPDPFILRVGSTYYAYATQTGAISVQRMQSADTVRWQHLGDALPILPLWAEWGHTWAPTVLRRGLNYLLYYT
ncbi:MAG: family 43 glycosylhydrolase, partial [Actinomycetota bacterium]|nr:family 43 glycosylhydrolase [Actinomycetota bacterium]